MSEKEVGFVFCRGGSKGVPGKNLRTIRGQSLLEIAIMDCRKAGLSEVVVSSDSQEILEVASQVGALVCERPDSLALDDSPEIEAWKHASDWFLSAFGPYDIFCSVPATSPLRRSVYIREALKKLREEKVDIVVGVQRASHHPKFNIVKGELGQLNIYDKNGSAFRRQDVPDAWFLTTCVYASRPSALKSISSIQELQMAGVEIDWPHSLDIDTETDLITAELLWDHFKK